MKTNIFLIVFFIFLPITYASSQMGEFEVNPESITKLYGSEFYWYFKPEDNIAFKNEGIDESTWYTIRLNDNWSIHQEFSDYRGIGWYRFHLVIQEVKDYSLFLPKSYRGVQVYINGNFAGETREFTSHGFTPPTLGRPQTLFLPASMWKSGDNLLALRTGELDGIASIDYGLKIGPVETIKIKFVHYLLRYGTLTFISLFLSLYYAFYFFYRKRDRYYVYYAGICFFLGIWIAGYSALILYFLDYYLIYVMFTYLGGIITPFFFINFIHSFLAVKNNYITKFFEIAYLSLAVSLIANIIIEGGIRFFHTYLYNIFQMLNILIVIYSLFITSLEVKKKTPYAFRILTGISIFSVTTILAVLFFLNILEFDDTYIIEGFFLMTIVFASVLAARFSQVHTDLERTHLELLELDKIKDEALENLNVYTHDQMAFIDTNYTILAANEPFFRAFNRSPGKTINHSLSEVFGEDEFEKNLKTCFDQCIGGEAVHFEKWFDYPIIGRRYMVAALYPYAAQGNDTKGVVLNLMDNTEKFQIEKSVVGISQNERRNIGIELHDGLSQKLLSIAIKTKMLSKSLENTEPPASLKANEIENLINSAVEDTRNLARGLFPLDLEEGGIDSFARELKQRIESKYNITFHIDINKTIELDDILVNTQLYYITQEAVNNAVRHSGGKQINISLQHDADRHVVLSITDDGIGIPDHTDKEGGIGLNIIKYRARMIGATLNITRGQNGGTQVVCRL
jgi:signal transduction histidine kinase